MMHIGSARVPKLSQSKRTRLANGILLVLLSIVGFVYFYPIILMCINGVKSPNEMAQNVLALPKKIKWDNIAYVFNDIKYSNLFMNTVIVTVIGIIGIISISSISAYILNRQKNRYTRIVHTILIAPMLIPFHTFMVTLLKVMVDFKLNGSLWGLGVQYWGFCTPMAVFIYYNFMNTVPKEIDECVRIDGASTLRAFFSVIFPLLIPVTVTILVLDIMWIWNDFALPLIMVNTTISTRTLTLGAYSYIGHFVTRWDYALCAMTMTVSPSIVVFILLQKYIVDGVVAGSIKG